MNFYAYETTKIRLAVYLEVIKFYALIIRNENRGSFAFSATLISRANWLTKF